MPKKKNKSPSCLRYEQNHPTISYRISKELYDRLQTVKQTEGRSTADVLKVTVGLFEMKIGKEDLIRRDGFQQGFQAARNRYRVTYNCTRCGHEMIVESDEEKKAIQEYMRQDGWSHKDCVPA